MQEPEQEREKEQEQESKSKREKKQEQEREKEWQNPVPFKENYPPPRTYYSLIGCSPSAQLSSRERQNTWRENCPCTCADYVYYLEHSCQRHLIMANVRAAPNTQQQEYPRPHCSACPELLWSAALGPTTVVGDPGETHKQTLSPKPTLGQGPSNNQLSFHMTMPFGEISGLTCHSAATRPCLSSFKKFKVNKAMANLSLGVDPAGAIPPFCLIKYSFKVRWARSIMPWP